MAVKFNQELVFVEHGGVPSFGNEAHQAFFGGGSISAWNQTEALGDAEVVAIDAEGSATQS